MDRFGQSKPTRFVSWRNQFNPRVIACFFYHLITLSAHVSTFGGIIRFWIFDFRFWIVGHRITLSALAKTFGGMANPICFAVFRLITSSNFVGCSTGMSAGLAPLRILSIWMAARRNTSA